MKIRIFARQLRDPEHLLQFVEPDHAVDEPGSVLALDDARIGLPRVGQFADQRLENVGQGHESFEIAVFIDDERHRLAARLEHFEGAQHRHRIRQKQRRAQRRAQIEWLSVECGGQQILDLNDAGELMRAALHDRKARIGAVADMPPDLLFGIIYIEKLDLGARRHDGADPAIAEPERHLDDCGLALRDVAGRHAFAQHKADFLVGNRRGFAAQRQQTQ